MQQLTNKEDQELVLKKELLPMEIGHRPNLPTLEDCTILGACKEEQGGRVATTDELLQKVVRMTCLLSHLETFSFFSFGGQPKRKEKEG